MSTDPEAAWNAVHDATPRNWFVGRPAYVERLNQWEQIAFGSRDLSDPLLLVCHRPTDRHVGEGHQAVWPDDEAS
jgi:hypothetical protein